jgi:hypothetical protein
MDTATNHSTATAQLISVEEARGLLRTVSIFASGSLALVLCTHLVNGVCGEILVKASFFHLFFH